MKKKLFHKITALTLTRRIIQVASLVLFPGLFISTFAAMKAIFVSLVGGTFDAVALTGQIVLALSMLLITAIMGRFFCGFLCAFGTMGDFLWYLGAKLKLKRSKIGTKFDRVLKKLKYVMLVLIVLLVWTLGVSLLGETANPWTAFGMLTKLGGWTDLTVILSIGMLLLLLIAAGSLYIERFFCRYLCPLGAVFGIVSKFRLFKIRKPRTLCGSCRACTKRCSMGIPLYRSGVVTSAECIDCMNCVEICPRENVSANPKPALAAAVAVVSLTGMYFAGNIAGTTAAERQMTAVAASLSTTQSANTGIFTNGTYTGSAQGYRGTTSVSLTIADGYITQIRVLSTGDDLEFFNLAKASVIPAIIKTQSVGVDTVTGATFSSNGLIEAVKNALAGTVASDTGDTTSIRLDEAALTDAPQLTPTPTPIPTPTPAPTEVPVATGPIALADGTYSGTGEGFRGETEVSVTVQNGSIASISIERYVDDERYFVRAKRTILDAILAAQSVEVDTVSGATYSSNGILEAVADALSLDFTATQPARGHRN
jgi:uncharacterized protein with FMN-binding domain